MVDLISHALWAYALFHRQSNVFAYVAFSLLPDLVFGLPALIAFTANGEIRQNFRRARRWQLPHETASKLPYFEFVRKFYHASHSWLVMGFTSLVLLAFAPQFALPFVSGVFLHLGMDLFVHKDSIAGQYPFYPLSNFRVKGFIHWSDKHFLVVNYGLLALLYALIFARVF